MNKPFALVTLFALFLSFTTPANAQETIFSNFASCTGVIDSVPFTLDFFEEVTSEKNISTGKGYVVQTMGPLSGESAKMMAKITISEKSDKNKKIVNMYAVLDPSILFSTFPIDLQKKSEVEVYARQFKAVWGKLSCTPESLP